MSRTEALYYVVNALPAPLWAVWIFAPKHAKRVAAPLWPYAGLAAIYAALIVLSIFWLDADTEGHMGSLSGVMAIFDREWATLAAWTHYLCFDAFVGRWIVLDVERPSYRLSPILALTLFFGPAGLLLYLVRRGADQRSGK